MRKTKQPTPSYGVYIQGHTQETVGTLSDSIQSILAAPHTDEETKRKALDVLQSGVQPPQSNFSYCTIQAGEVK